MRHRWLLLPLCIVGVALVLSARPWRYQFRAVLVDSHERPNVVLVSLDTTRPDHLGCYGYDKGTSPNLDKFVTQGVRFACARAQASWTLPSHMSLFTSLLPSHNGVDNTNSLLAEDIPTLAQLLAKEGYHAAGIVNDGQVKSTWGFQRGFETWREFPAESPQGNCEHITDEALGWLGQAPASPFFLFVHYYDPHDPYDPPEPFRSQLGVTLTRQQASRIVHRRLAAGEEDTVDATPEMLTRVKASYDGEIAWMDHELGRLFDAVPPNTVVVVFSDHGEAFFEHGATQHGSTLYEEEVRVALLVRGEGIVPAGKVVNEPVMLLDVAPTILGLCGAPAPTHLEGTDLSPLWRDEHGGERLILSETKWPAEGQVLKMASVGDWKLIGSVFHGNQQLYRLPDEKTDRSKAEPAMAKALGATVRGWIAEEEFWIVSAHGPGRFLATFTSQGPQYALPLRLGPEEITDRFQGVPNGRSFQWSCAPAGGTLALFLQPIPPNASVSFDFLIDNVRRPDQVFVGPKRRGPAALPGPIDPREADCGPYTDRPLRAEVPGFQVQLFRPPGGSRRAAKAIDLDARTLQQLRSLGYLQ